MTVKKFFKFAELFDILAASELAGRSVLSGFGALIPLDTNTNKIKRTIRTELLTTIFTSSE
jgi:hypothetical protein